MKHRALTRPHFATVGSHLVPLLGTIILHVLLSMLEVLVFPHCVRTVMRAQRSFHAFIHIRPLPALASLLFVNMYHGRLRSTSHIFDSSIQQPTMSGQGQGIGSRGNPANIGGFSAQNPLPNTPPSGVRAATSSPPPLYQPGNRPSPTPNVPTSLIPKDALKFGTFRGHPSDKASAGDFLFRAETVLGFFPDVPDRSKIKLLLASFPSDSPAGAWFIAEFNKFTTFYAFKQAFLARFGVSRTERLLLRQQLERFQQRDSDSVSAYYTAFLNLVTQIKLSGHEYAEADLIAKFVGGLKKNVGAEVISEQLRANRDFSLAELAKIAENCEAAARIIRRNASHANGSASGTNNAAVKPHVNAIQSKQWCIYHKTSSHSTENCAKVKALIKAGVWKDGSRNKST